MSESKLKKLDPILEGEVLRYKLPWKKTRLYWQSAPSILSMYQTSSTINNWIKWGYYSIKVYGEVIIQKLFLGSSELSKVKNIISENLKDIAIWNEFKEKEFLELIKSVLSDPKKINEAILNLLVDEVSFGEEIDSYDFWEYNDLYIEKIEREKEKEIKKLERQKRQKNKEERQRGIESSIKMWQSTPEKDFSSNYNKDNEFWIILEPEDSNNFDLYDFLKKYCSFYSYDNYWMISSLESDDWNIDIQEYDFDFSYNNFIQKIKFTLLDSLGNSDLENIYHRSYEKYLVITLLSSSWEVSRCFISLPFEFWRNERSKIPYFRKSFVTCKYCWSYNIWTNMLKDFTNLLDFRVSEMSNDSIKLDILSPKWGIWEWLEKKELHEKIKSLFLEKFTLIRNNESFSRTRNGWETTWSNEVIDLKTKFDKSDISFNPWNNNEKYVTSGVSSFEIYLTDWGVIIEGKTWSQSLFSLVLSEYTNQVPHTDIDDARYYDIPVEEKELSYLTLYISLNKEDYTLTLKNDIPEEYLEKEDDF